MIIQRKTLRSYNIRNRHMHTVAAIEQALLTWIHLVSAAIWVGGSIFIGVVFSPLLRSMTDSVEERMRIMIRVGRRFNLVAAPALAVLVATGIYSAQGLLVHSNLLLASSYGTFLTAKVALVAALVITYAIHVWIIRRDVEEQIMSGKFPKEKLPSLRRKIIILGELSVILSVTVLFFAALLDAGV